METTNKRSRKYRESQLTIRLAAGCTILALVLSATFFYLYWNQRKKVIMLETQIETLTAELAAIQIQQQSVPAESEAPSELAPELPQTEAETIPETEPQPAETTSAPYLQSLSGISPGTVIDADKIDFSRIDDYFMTWKIEEGDNLYDRINGKSYRKNDYISLGSLRYLKLPHYNFNGQIQVGELIVGEDITDDTIRIFKELFAAKYQIYSMYLIDNYWTGNAADSDDASIDVNNTSAFCYRAATGGSNLSKHAYGRAIDINPQQNPYVSYSTGSPRWSHPNADAYIARDTGLDHVITYDDLAYKVFTKYGFTWGGDWNNPKDYQHFEMR